MKLMNILSFIIEKFFDLMYYVGGIINHTIDIIIEDYETGSKFSKACTIFIIVGVSIILLFFIWISIKIAMTNVYAEI